MRESIGGMWIFGLVISFILLFTGFLALAINYSRVFKSKNETISFIERNQGYNKDSIPLINNYLEYVHYNNKGKCPGDYYGVSDYGSKTATEVINNEKYYYCIKLNRVADGRETCNYDSQEGEYNCSPSKVKYYYDIILFFEIDLPVVGQFANFTIEGQTETLYTINSNNPDKLYLNN